MKNLVLIILIFVSLKLYSSPQAPDFIIFKKDTIATYNLLLELYLQKLDTVESNKLFGLSFRDGASTNCWRGYQAIYKIESDSVFLVAIISCGELRNKKFDRVASVEKMKSIFRDKVINNKVYIDWFSGVVNFPLKLNNKILRWDGVFYTIYEKEAVINIVEGKVENIENVNNYVDTPNGIDRRNKEKVSKVLFKKIKKTKWKNSNDYDCSTTYWVTIDENGDVSKVRMTYANEEIKKYYDDDEYSFCINKIYDALKDLKFDIIKNKGKPISEDIYIEIWIEDNGKVKN